MPGGFLFMCNILSFISKYRLNQEFDNVRWHYQDGTLRVHEASWDKRIVVDVTARCSHALPPIFVIPNSHDLARKANALHHPFDIAYEEGDDDVPRLIFTDDRNTLIYHTGDIDHISFNPKNIAIPTMEYKRTLLTKGLRQYIPNGKVTPDEDDNDTFLYKPASFTFYRLPLLQVMKANRECHTFHLSTSRQGLSIATFECPTGITAKYYMVGRPTASKEVPSKRGT